MAKATVIDTGQSLGKNVMIQNGKVVSTGASGATNLVASTSSASAESPVMAVSSPVRTLVSDKKLEPKTYFSYGDSVRVYRDSSGGYWLTTSPVISFLIVGLLVGGAVFALLTASALKRKKERKALRAQSVSNVEVSVSEKDEQSSIVENIVEDLIEDTEPEDAESGEIEPIKPIENAEVIDESEEITPRKPKFKKLSL